MKIQITIQTLCYEPWFMIEEECISLDQFYEEIEANGVFWPEERFCYDNQTIMIYKHKTFGYISAFNTNYRKERFQ